MRIKRSVRIRGIQKPAFLILFSNNIDHSADSVRSETDGNDTFIHLNALGIIDRNIIQTERTPDTFLRDTVNKHLDMFTAESVHHQLHIRTYTARFSDFHTRSLCQSLTQILCRIL